MKPLLLFLLTGLFALCFFPSCKYDSVEELHPLAFCDTVDTVSYSGYIVPLFNASCGAAEISCHKTGTLGSTVYLDDYLSTTLVDTSLMLGCVRHTSGFKPMPKDGGKLDECAIYKLGKWIHAGEPNN
jgi:hypothetical protein